MKLHTQDYKTNIKNYGRKIDSKITYTINEVETELGKKQLNSVTPHFEGDILKSTMKQIDIDANIEIPEGTILNYQFGVKVDGTYEYINYGNYIVYKVEKQEDTNSYMMTCYDKMLYAMKDYEDLGVTYPISVKDYIQALCNKLGLVFKNANETFPNYDKQIDKELYLDSEGYSLDYTYRDVLDELAQVTASTICINDNDELELRYIKDATYNKTATGEGNITIQDGTDTSLVGCNIEGNNYQETYQGKNLFDASKITDTTIVVNNNGKDIIMPVKTSGNGYNPVASKLSIVCPTLQAGDVVYLHMDRSPYDTMKIAYLNGSSSVWNNHASHTITQAELDGVFTLYANNYTNGETEQVTISNLIISKTNITSSNDWEPYVGGTTNPNPDYPQEVEVVEGKNMITTFYDRGERYISYNIDNTKLTNTITYSFIPNFSLTNVDVVIRTINSAGIYNKGRINLVQNTLATLTMELTNEELQTLKGSSSIIQIYKSGSNFDGYEITNVQLESGVATQYLPYNNIGVNVVGKNLLKVQATTTTSSGVTWNVNEDGTIDVSGTATGYSALFVGYAYVNSSMGKVTLSGIKATSINIGWESVYLQDINGNNLATIVSSGRDDVTFDLSSYSNAYRIRYALKRINNIAVSGTIKPQVEIGNNVTEYVSYSNITTPIDLQGNFIGKIGSIKDELSIDDLGNVILTKRIGKVVLNGSEEWSTEGTNQTGKYRMRINHFENITNNNYLKPVSNSTLPPLLSNYYVPIYAGSTGTYGCIQGVSLNQNTALLIYDNTYNTNDATSYKTWLSTHNIILYYALATPYQVNLGKANIELNEGVNYITFLTGLDTRNTIEYGYEKEQIDERFLKDINVDFGKKYGPINSIVLSRSAESDRVYLQDEDSIEANGLCELKIIDNQIMNWQNRSDFIPDILNQLDGLEYYLNDYSSTGITYLELCDRYEVKIKDNVYSCIMFNDELDVTTGIQEMIHTDEPKETETDYKKADKTDRKINQAYIIVDKQQNEITAQANRINIIATHIDETTGDVREVTTITGFTFNADGLNIYKNDTTFNTQINNIGTYYKDGNTILSQTTKDGTKTKDLDVFGYYRYGEDDINDEPLFIAVKYTDGNNEEGYGHFYNG